MYNDKINELIENKRDFEFEKERAIAKYDRIIKAFEWKLENLRKLNEIELQRKFVEYWDAYDIFMHIKEWKEYRYLHLGGRSKVPINYYLANDFDYPESNLDKDDDIDYYDKLTEEVNKWIDELTTISKQKGPLEEIVKRVLDVNFDLQELSNEELEAVFKRLKDLDSEFINPEKKREVFLPDNFYDRYQAVIDEKERRAFHR